MNMNMLMNILMNMIPFSITLVCYPTVPTLMSDTAVPAMPLPEPQTFH